MSYTIISEQGVSFYSCSSEAATEFPDLDPTFVGAGWGQFYFTRLHDHIDNIKFF